MNHRPLLAYFGHHKCGTIWINKNNQAICEELGLNFANLHLPEAFDEQLDIYVKKNNINFLAYTNANLQYVNQLQQDFLGFHVIRDPRDMLVSGYFSHRNSHPTNIWPPLVDHRRRLLEVSKEEGLMLEMDFSNRFYEDMRTWDYNRPNIMEIKMEDLMDNSQEILLKAYKHLGLTQDEFSLRTSWKYLIYKTRQKIRSRYGWRPLNGSSLIIPVQFILWIMYQNRYSVLSGGRKRGSENVNSHFRKGVAGDWVNHFNDQHREEFKKRFGNLLIQLGYESNLDW